MLMQRHFKLCLLLTLSHCLVAEQADILADFDLDDIPTHWKKITENDFQLGLFSFGNLKQYANQRFSSDVKRVIIMNPYVASSEQDLALIPQEKLVLFSWEPAPISPSFYNKVGRVYTYNDLLVDGKQFFKLFYPFRQDMIPERPTFQEKKLCTLVARHWTPERIKMVEFFDKNTNNELEFYGSEPGPFGNNKNYLGPIAGYHSGKQKISTLKNYRFCICFENTYHLPGYITEKIFSCFAAGCVPIYFGAPNIAQYIPPNCFIDYRKFSSMHALYTFIKRMPEQTYEQYILNIQAFLASEQAYKFSPEYFETIVQDAITQN